MAFFFRSWASSSYVFALAANWLANPPLPPVVLGLKPPAGALLVDGLNPLAVNGLATPENGWEPGTEVANFEGSRAGFSVAFCANMFVGSKGTEVLLLIALENKAEVAVAGGGLNLGIEADGCGVGVVGVSVGRDRFEGDASRFSGLSSLTLRFVDKDDSLPVTPFAVARSFFARSIFFLIAELC
jgi:hypothetical protein